jgi:hypothetical protein
VLLHLIWFYLFFLRADCGLAAAAAAAAAAGGSYYPVLVCRIHLRLWGLATSHLFKTTFSSNVSTATCVSRHHLLPPLPLAAVTPPPPPPFRTNACDGLPVQLPAAIPPGIIIVHSSTAAHVMQPPPRILSHAASSTSAASPSACFCHRDPHPPPTPPTATKQPHSQFCEV